MALALSRALTGEHDVDVATSSSEGLQQILLNSYDVIFCDLMMPVASGTDFYRALAACAPHMLDRLIFMTGGVFSTQTNDFLDSVPNSCIEKPFDLGALLALINERLR